MPRFALANDRAGGDIEGREERRGAASKVLVGDTFDVSKPQWQDRLAALQGLYLGLSIDTQDQQIIRGFRYKPTMSRTFWTKNGSVDIVKVRVR